MINGDNISGIRNKLLYFPQCLFNATKGTKYGLTIRKVNLIANKKIISTGSPSRRLSNMFWDTINWQGLSSELGQPVSILDLGCGRGTWGHRYRKYLGTAFKSYSGLDVYKDVEFPNEFNHILDKAENAFMYVDGINFVVSQSALEHIEGDIECLSKLVGKLVENEKKFVQIHLVPASASLFLYLWHGWRQYSKKNLGKISMNLKSDCDLNFEVVPLGGVRCFLSHFFRITLKNLFHKISGTSKNKNWHFDNNKDSIAIKKSVCSERNIKSFMPSFWAIIISNAEIETDNLFAARLKTHR